MNPIKKLNFYINLAGGWEIARRYLVMNGFDGVLTVLGVVLGAFLLETNEPIKVLGPGFGASIAIGVSGFWIAFLTEEAEQIREKQKMEEMLFTKLDESVYSRAGRVASFVNSIVDGASPFIFGSIVLIPFFFVDSVMNMSTAYYSSFTLAGILLFILGLFLGKLSSSNMLIFGIKTLMAGVMVSILIFFTGIE